jgi:hypothetical protein
MNLAMRFSKPTLSVRKAMVALIAQGAGFRLDEGVALDLARSSTCALPRVSVGR